MLLLLRNHRQVKVLSAFGVRGQALAPLLLLRLGTMPGVLAGFGQGFMGDRPPEVLGSWLEGDPMFGDANHAMRRSQTLVAIRRGR